MLHEQDATVEALLALIETVWAQPRRYRAAISDQQAGDGTEKIIELIDTVTGKKPRENIQRNGSGRGSVQQLTGRGLWRQA